MSDELSKPVALTPKEQYANATAERRSYKNLRSLVVSLIVFCVMVIAMLIVTSHIDSLGGLVTTGLLAIAIAALIKVFGFCRKKIVFLDSRMTSLLAENPCLRRVTRQNDGNNPA